MSEPELQSLKSFAADQVSCSLADVTLISCSGTPVSNLIIAREHSAGHFVHSCDRHSKPDIRCRRLRQLKLLPNNRPVGTATPIDLQR